MRTLLLSAAMRLLGVTVFLGSFAAFAQDISRPLVVDVTTMTKEPRRESVQALIAEKTPLTPGTYPLISGSDPMFTERFRWLYPNASDVACPEGLPELEAYLKQARSLIIELELKLALGMLNSAFETLPCRAVDIDQMSVRNIFYLEGIAHYYDGDLEACSRSFLAALTIAPDAPPMSEDPPEVDEVYQTSRQMLQMWDPVKIDVDPAMTQVGLKVDGVVISSLEPTLSLRPGRHFAQVFNAEGIARTAIFSVESGESRQMAELMPVMPPGSASYLNALLRTALQNKDVEPEQLEALEAYAKLENHPAIMFVMVSSDAPGGQVVVSFVPGGGILDGGPTWLEPLPPMPGMSPDDDAKDKKGFFARRREQRAKAFEARQKRARTDDSGIAFGGPSSSTGRPRDPAATTRPRPSATSTVTEDELIGFGEESKPSSGGVTVFRLEIGSLSYQQAFFANFLPSVSIGFTERLKLHAGFQYANNFGAGSDDVLTITGLTLGPEYELPFGAVALRVGIGFGFSAARVITDDGGGSTLLLEGTPEGWLGGDFNLSSQARIGAIFAGGYSPGLFGPGGAHGLWRAGLVLGFSL